jgi:hypothetical protein
LYLTAQTKETYFNTLLMSIDELPQRIDPEKWKGMELKPGFGYTISKVGTGSNRKLDVDGNECNDFAVGYPQTNKVVLLRSKEVVMLQAKKSSNGIRLKYPPFINPPFPAEEGKCFVFNFQLATFPIILIF